MSRVFAIAAAALLAHTASAQTVLYSNTFETGPIGPEWSSNTTRSHESAFSWFVGRYAQNQGVTLTLAAPPPPTSCGGSGGGAGGGSGGNSGGSTGVGGGDSCYNQLFLTFDLHIIDSWDGYLTPHGPDSFQIFINSTKVFDETFANQHEFQSFRAPDVGPVHLGYNPMYRDSIYRDIVIPFDVGSDPTISIQFRSQGLLSAHDESWGIDNVRVTYTPVPSTGSAVLFAVGTAIMARRRRN